MIKKISGFFLQNVVSIWGIVLTFLIGGVWFFRDGYILMTDLAHGPNVDYNWNASGIFFQFLLYIFDFISTTFSSKFIYIFTFLLLYFAGVHLAKNITENKYLQILAGSFSVLNLFIYERILYGQVGVVLAAGFLILFFSYVYKIYFVKEKLEAEITEEDIKQERNLASPNFAKKNILLAGIFAGLAIDSSVHVVFFIIFTLAIFFIFQILEFYQKSFLNIKSVINLFLQNCFIFLISLFVNIGFIVNTFFGRNQVLDFTSSKISELDLVAFQTVGESIFIKIFNVLMLTGFWGREQKRFLDITDSSLWYIAFLPFIFVVIFGIVKIFKNNKKLFYILISFFVFIPILSVATSISTLDFLYKYIPFFSGLREPQKWTMLLIPVYIVAILNGIKYFAKEELKKVSIGFLVILIIFQHKFLFGMWGQMMQVPYPSSWYQVDEIMKRDDTNCKKQNLFLPWHLYMSFPFTKNIIANPSSYFFTCPFVSGTNMEFGNIFDNNLNDKSTKYGFWLFESREKPPENTGFIFVSKTVDWERYNWLRENIYLEKILENDEVILYKVKN